MALEIKNQEIFDKVVSDAIEAAITNSGTDKLAKRWENAIDRAVAEINENPYLHYDTEKNQLIILSSSSNNIYSSNGVCQCLAFLTGKMPCWHRAAARIWRLYLEAGNKPLPPSAAVAAAPKAFSMNDASYLKPVKAYKPQTVGGIRI